MNVRESRGLNLGIVLVGLGLFFLLRRELNLSGPGPVLLIIGAILFTLSAARGFQGPVVPACVLLGLGAAFLLRDPLDPWIPSWATILLGIGGGLLLASGIDRQPGHERRPSTFVPGLVLVVIAAVAALAANFHFPAEVFDAVWRFWPWALVAAGVILIVQGFRRKST